MRPALPVAELLARARHGDRDALGELWRRHNPALVRYLRARAGDALAEDLASRTWIDAARDLGAFRGDDDGFRRWLFTIGRRRLTDELRRRGRRPERLSAEVEPGSYQAPNPHDELDAALALVRRLTEDQAEAVLLRIVADLDVAAVAAIMGRTEGAVRALTHRGLHRLAELLSDGPGVSAPGAPEGEPSPGLGNVDPGVTTAAPLAIKGSR